MKAIYSCIDQFFAIFLNAYWSSNLTIAFSLVALLIILFVIHYLTKVILKFTVIRFFRKTKTEWDDYLVNRGVLKALAHLPAALFLSYNFDFCSHENIVMLLDKIAQIYYVVIFSLVVSRSLNAVDDMFQSTVHAQGRSIKGYIQLIQIFVFVISAIISISILSDKNISGILAGMSAMAAILLLVFKDSILGFVASIQLSVNEMLKPGDWISMPNHGADGTVIDISLNTVKVQNWDKTITTIPTYALVSGSFNNWSGMQESGGRRIKRSINIDMTSVKFCEGELLAKLKKFHLLKEYLTTKEKEIQEFNMQLNLEHGDVYNGKRQTNLGIFRQYLDAYLRNNPHIHGEMTFLVRHLQPTEKGIPLEIYVFSNDQRWANYESIQADIFDHVLAIIPEFELRIFQSPSGYDFSQMNR